MVFLHGYKSCKESFYYQIEYFSRFYRVTAFDMSGFGQSDSLDKPMSVDDYVQEVCSLFKKLRISQPVVVAHSFGARVAIKGIGQGIFMPSHLVIVSGAGISKSNSPHNIRKVKRYRRVKRYFPKFAERHFGSSEYKSLTPIEKKSFKLIVNEDLSESAKQISCPVLLIYGEEDTVTPISQEGQTFNKLIKHSRLLSMRGGHFCFSQYPALFNSYVYNFLTEQKVNC